MFGDRDAARDSAWAEVVGCQAQAELKSFTSALVGTMRARDPAAQRSALLDAGVLDERSFRIFGVPMSLFGTCVGTRYDLGESEDDTRHLVAEIVGEIRVWGAAWGAASPPKPEPSSIKESDEQQMADMTERMLRVALTELQAACRPGCLMAVLNELMDQLFLMLRHAANLPAPS
jgi:hypothetical protein